jgi:hypothetical protein
MPRRSNGPRLWLDKERDTWTIIDGRSRIRTGCATEEAGRAQEALRDYLASKHKVADGPDPLLADVFSAYVDEALEGKLSEVHIQYDIARLSKFWGKKRVSEVSYDTCKAYVAHRNGLVSSGKELAYLTAAMRHWHKMLGR